MTANLDEQQTGADGSSPTTTGPLATREQVIRGWRSPLAAIVSTIILLEVISGLWLYAGTFSVAAQILVLLHVCAGICLVVPVLFYLIQHFLVWRGQKLTTISAMGYALALAAAACGVSGVVLTAQAVVGPRLSVGWDQTHLISGIVTGALLLVHLLTAFGRRRPAARSDPALASAWRLFMRRGLVGLSATALLVAAAAMTWPTADVEREVPAEYHLSEYVNQFDEYRGSSFAPSYARTASGQLVNPEVLAGSSSCGTAGCHEQILAEWEPSAHRFSAMNPPFQQIQKNFAAQRSAEETRYCAGCHDPISLFAGAKDIHNLSLSAPGMQEGCSCVVCHSIDQVDQRGNGDYVLVPPRKYLWENETGWKKQVSDFLIRAFPRQHLADYDRTLLRSPEFCGACHKQFIPEALNRFGLVSGQNQYDEWRESHWHADDPDSNLTCIDCHMRLVRESTDPGRGEEGAERRSPDDGAHRHHGMIATNFLMPQVLKLPHWERHVELTKQWMRGETVIEEIADVWPPGPVAPIEILAPPRVRRGEEVSLRVVVTNQKAGHNLTTGPLDFMRAWVHLRVTDARGQLLAEWGAIDPQTRRITDEPGQEHRIGNSRKQGTLVLEGQPIDGTGAPILRHELWSKAGGKGQRVIFPGYSDNHQYTLRLPPDAEGPLVVTADFNFRRYRQEFLDLVVPHMELESGVQQPVVTQSTTEARIEVDDAIGDERDAPPPREDSP